MEGANTFSVQTSVLGEALADQHRDIPFDEFSDSPGIPVQVAAGEALVGAVEKGVVTLLYHHVRDLTPLFPGGIYAGRVVSTCVEDEDGTVRGRIKGTKELVESETNGLGVVVLVMEGLESDIPEDIVMVCYKELASGICDVSRGKHRHTPRRVGEVDLLRPIETVELAEEQGPSVIGPGTRHRLDGGNALVCEGGRIITQNNAGRSGDEVGETDDRKVLVVKIRIVE